LDDQTAIFITTNSPISLPLPALSYDYEDLNFILFQDESVTSSMTISNSGEEGSVLSYSVSKTGVTPFEVIGGNDSYGHVWSDSNLDNEIEQNRC